MGASDIAYVIGGAGFLGRHLVARLLRDGWRVGVIDPIEPAAEVTHARGRVTSETLAVLSSRLGAPTHVFHLGGGGSVGIAAADPALDRALAVESTELVVGSLSSARLVLVSSAAVYGETHEGPIREQAACAPISVYGRHKLEAEQRAAGHAVVRLFSVYGPGLRKQLLWDACEKLRRGEASFGGTGAELRDWLHVDDAIDLLVTVAALEEPLIVNGGTGVPTAVATALGQLRSHLGVATPLEFSGETRPGDPQALVADTARARALGWAARVPLADGLAEYARWYRTC